MDPETVQELADNLPRTAQRLLAFKVLFPGADLVKIISKSPTVLLLEIEAVKERRLLLERFIKQHKLDATISLQPDLLTCNARFLWGGSGD